LVGSEMCIRDRILSRPSHHYRSSVTPILLLVRRQGCATATRGSISLFVNVANSGKNISE
ncbi:MAG: hypothetical protein N2444_02720, partial [Methylocystis sp.]|nr:hypothetical protein [Methylocystis sp.]